MTFLNSYINSLIVFPLGSYSQLSQSAPGLLSSSDTSSSGRPIISPSTCASRASPSRKKTFGEPSSADQGCGQSKIHVFLHNMYFLLPALYYACIVFARCGDLYNFCCAHMYSGNITVEATSCAAGGAPQTRVRAPAAARARLWCRRIIYLLVAQFLILDCCFYSI